MNADPGRNASADLHAAPMFRAPGGAVAPFEYRLLSGRELEEGMGNGLRNGRNDDAEFSADGALVQQAGSHKGGASSKRLTSEGLEAAREEGRRTGEREGRSAAGAELELQMDEMLSRERASLAETVKQFSCARERYFLDVEREVVRLSLAIAARVLHREAQMDPLMLAGVVRVALEKMADRTGVVLRVRPADVTAWEDALRTIERSERPLVMEDAALNQGECVLETKMGTVELGVSAQLEEIERGFFDLLNHRPAL
jgi:flagellar assembly protein FliH